MAVVRTVCVKQIERAITTYIYKALPRFLPSLEMSLHDFILALEKVEAIKFGKFTLKSGQESLIYFDLCVLVFYPDLLLTSSMAVEAGVGMVVRRKEAKDYGTKKMVEGVWKDGQNCVVVKDIVTTGGSVVETAELLRKQGMEVTDCVVQLDRQQGGEARLGVEGLKLHSVLKVIQRRQEEGG